MNGKMAEFYNIKNGNF